MISEGPSLIEILPGELQGALKSALRPGEELLVAVGGNAREAFAATRERLLLFRSPVISGTGTVEVREVPLGSVSRLRVEARSVGGRLAWESTAAGAPTSVEYPMSEVAKFERVARRLQEMATAASAEGAPTLTTRETGAGDLVPAAEGACAKCGTSLPEEACWCPRCGVRVAEPCWECGRALGSDAKFCPSCGTANTEPAVVQCPQCGTSVARGHPYCSACGTQARVVCGECDRPLRREWKACPTCGGEPVWEDAGIGGEIAHLTGDEPEDPSAWLAPSPRLRNGEELNAAGARAYESGNYREAIRLFQEATEADPGNASYYTNLGVAFGEVGDDLQAFTAYRRAVELNPEELAAYLNMGYLYMERERPTEAREMWEAVVRAAPDSDEAKEARDNLSNMEDV